MRFGIISDDGTRAVGAITSQHAVALVLDWDQAESADLLGFAIRRTELTDGTSRWLEGALAFEGEEHRVGEPVESRLAPIQKMFWADYTVRLGARYMYTVIPVHGTTPAERVVDESRSLTLEVEVEGLGNDKPHEVFFNRAVVASQAYTRNFGDADPTSDPRILRWLARGLDRAMLGFLEAAATDPAVTVDVAAYHMTHDAIIDAIAALGDRARASLCWKKDADQEKNADAARRLRQAGVRVFYRDQVPAISHNKYVVLRRAGEPVAVMTGSTNFTYGGVSLQNNVMHLIRDPGLAQLYADNFELLCADDTNALRAANGTWQTVQTAVGQVDVNFSPHKAKDRVDLNRYVELARGASRSVLFALFRATDAEVIDAMINPVDTNGDVREDVLVRGLVDKVYEDSPSAGEVELYHRAWTRDPDVVAATPINRPVDPLEPERPREGFAPLVHHKFILIDVDTDRPVLVTGSANYSRNSTEKNDENTLVITGHRRAADMYLVEFTRIYEHYRARWALFRSRREGPLYLTPDASWADKYFDPANQSAKFVACLRGAAGLPALRQANRHAVGVRTDLTPA